MEQVFQNSQKQKIGSTKVRSISGMIFSSLYNAPVSFYAILSRNMSDVVIEQYDHYNKQTYRNRCRILGANGIIDLVIPVVKFHGKKVHVKDIRIDYDTPWHKNHWKSIVSAYASAPFFEFMYDSFSVIYKKKYTFLADLNQELMYAALDLLQLQLNISRSKTYLTLDPESDIREVIHPKRKFRHTGYKLHPVEYQQVFSERHGFIADLSILDLLFNEGTNANAVLQKSITKHENTRPD